MAEAEDGSFAAQAAIGSGHDQALAALRARGADRLAPVRLQWAESMARRAAAQQGAARRVLDDRVAVLLQSVADEIEQRVVAPADAREPVAAGAEGQGALAGLVDHIARHKSAWGPVAAAAVDAPPHIGPQLGLPGGADTLQFFRQTWSRLSARQRLAQSLETLPRNAGPLNSQQLLHHALTAMSELSPAYFEHFIGHIDALLWIERSNEQAAKEVGLSPKSKSAKGAKSTKAPGATRRS